MVLSWISSLWNDNTTFYIIIIPLTTYLVSHWGTCLVFTILDLTLKPLEDFKVQQGSISKLDTWLVGKHILKSIIINLKLQFFFVLPLLVIHRFQFWIQSKEFSLETQLIPSFPKMIFQFITLILSQEFILYCLHRFILHEIDKIFQKVHKKHHLQKYPFCVDALIMHPVELLVDTIPNIINMIIIQPYFWVHIFFIFYITTFNLIIHSGFLIFYNHPKIQNWIPIIKILNQLIKDHDLHHQYEIGNYGTMRFLDYLFKTRTRDYQKSLSVNF